MDLYDVMRTTPAVREFTDDPLPDETLHRILDHARFAPSGGNRQGTRVIVVRDQETRRRLAELNGPAVRRYVAQSKAGQSPWNPLEAPAPTAEEIAATAVPEAFTAPLLTAGAVLVVCVDLALVAAMDQDLDRVGLVSGASVYPLVWNILLAARNEGYGGTITTMAVAQEDRVKELLGIPERFALAAVVPLGRPVREVTRLRRHPVEELASLERFDGEPLRSPDQAPGVEPGSPEPR
ncbi:MULTISPECIES: nitroreductase family protein [unclassified Nocardioides]|uniref:nitroreductase family protein n=1 Tax=unclassified Nocardioides TaxID=2615069 RepID=UPI000056FEDD|nr:MULTISPECIES: nitroreductase family protein [unclassified Nocardioides]ABL82085.1 nitroreductase [Nocardioides sp. JS614]